MDTEHQSEKMNTVMKMGGSLHTYIQQFIIYLKETTLLTNNKPLLNIWSHGMDNREQNLLKDTHKLNNNYKYSFAQLHIKGCWAIELIIVFFSPSISNDA